MSTTTQLVTADTVYRSPKDVAILTERDELDGGEVVPGFRCAVSELFV